MSEIGPLPFSFECTFHEEAISFRDKLAAMEVASDEEAREKLSALLSGMNNRCGYLGLSLAIKSENHLIDWSHAEVKGCSLQRANGILKGTFIGFGMLPYDNPLTGDIEPSLAVIMDSTIYESDIDHFLPIVIATPIATAEIKLLTE